MSKKRDSLKSLKTLLFFIKGYKKAFVIGLIALAFSSFATMIFPKVLGSLVDIVSQGEKEVNRFTLWLLLLFLLMAVFSWIKVYSLSYVAQKALGALRIDVFKKLIKSPISFFNQQKVGALCSRVSSDVALLEETYTVTIAEFLRLAITIPIGLFFLMSISFRLTLFMLAVIPFVAIIGIFFGKFIKKLTSNSQSALADSTTIFNDALHTIKDVKSYTNEWFELLKYTSSINTSLSIAIKRGFWRALFISLIMFASGGAIIGIIWYGLHMVQLELTTGNGISLGDLVSFAIYSGVLGVSFSGMAEIYAKLQKAFGASEHLFLLLDNTQEDVKLLKPDKDNQPEKLTEGLVFNKVSFTYPSRKDVEVLKEISFEVNTGKKLAIVGESGAGKSTIVSLLLRFYEPASGQIILGGNSIENLNLTQYRKKIALVPQETILFNGTIRENIAYGNPEASDDEIIAAAKISNSLSFIERFPDKLETIVGDRGVMLSGGQKQRISIARAALKKPELLVLDEATSSLDSSSELKVQEGLLELMKGRTSVIIAHRLSTLENADTIMVLDKGEIVEQGTHQSLMKNKELYYRFYSLQKLV